VSAKTLARSTSDIARVKALIVGLVKYVIVATTSLGANIELWVPMEFFNHTFPLKSILVVRSMLWF